MDCFRRLVQAKLQIPLSLEVGLDGEGKGGSTNQVVNKIVYGGMTLDGSLK